MSDETQKPIGKTWHDVVRGVYGPVSDEDCSFLLWNATAYPYCGPEHVERQLREHWDAGRRTPGAAVAWSEAETERQMREMSDAEEPSP